MPGYSLAGEDRSIEQRVRSSAQIRDLPPVSREVAAAMFGHVIRTRRAAGELRDSLRKMIDVDAALGFRPDFPLEFIDPKIEALSSQMEALERTLGPDPAASPLSDEELFNALGTLSIAYTQLARLEELRDRLTFADAAGMREPESSDRRGWRDLKAERSRLAESAFRARLELAGLDETYQFQTRLLVYGLGKEKITQEFDEVNSQQLRIRRCAGEAGIGTAEATKTALRLIDERRRLLSGYLNGLESSSVGAGSKLLVPLPAQAERVSSVLAEWEGIRRDLMRSVAERAAIAAELRPRLQERNRLLAELRNAAEKSEAVSLSLMKLLADAEEVELLKIQSLWSDIGSDLKKQIQSTPAVKSAGFYEKAVDMGITLDSLQALETRILAGMGPFLADVIRLAGNPGADDMMRRLRELTGRLEADRNDLADLSALAGREAETWVKFDAWLARLMEARIGFWTRAQSVLNRRVARGVGDGMADSLKALARERIAGASADLDRFRQMQGEFSRDPVMRTLYGTGRYMEWISRAVVGDAVQQGLRELLQEAGTLDDLEKAAGPGESGETRGAALVRLTEALALPWVLVTRGDGMDFATQISNAGFVVEGIDGPAPRLRPAPPKTRGAAPGVRYASRAPGRILLADREEESPEWLRGPMPDSKRFTYNMANSIGNQVKKNWLTYAIIGVGGVIAGGVGLAYGAKAAVGAIVRATVMSAGSQYWQDLNFGGAKGYARTYYTPEQYRQTVKWEDRGETFVNVATGTVGVVRGGAGLVSGGQKAVNEVRSAESAFDAAKDTQAIVSGPGEARKTGYEILREFVRAERGEVEGTRKLVNLTSEMVGSERRTVGALEEATKGVVKAEQSLKDIQKAYRDLVWGAGRYSGTADNIREVAQGADAGDAIGGVATLSGPVLDAIPKGAQPVTTAPTQMTPVTPVTPENRRRIDEQDKAKLDQTRKSQQAANPPPKKEPTLKKEPPLDEGTVPEDPSKDGNEYDPVKAFAERDQKRSDEVGGRGLNAGIGQYGGQKVGPSTEKPGEPYKRPPPPPVKPPAPPVKPPVSGGGGGSATLGPDQWYHMVAVTTFEKTEYVGATPRQVTCTFTVHLGITARSQSELDEQLRSWGKSVLSIAASSGSNAKLISTSVVDGPSSSSSQLKIPNPNFTYKCL
jgi:hypothetical protein